MAKTVKTNNHNTPKAKRIRKKAKKPLQFIPAYLPANLDLEELLTKNPPWFEYHIDNFKYIIGLITEIPLYDKDILRDYDYVPIHGQTLQKRVHDYKVYIHYLLRYKVLETDNHYITGKKSIGYRFTKQYATHIKRTSISKPSLVKWNKRQATARQEDQLKYNYLYKWLSPALKIDNEAGMKYLNEILQHNLKHGVENAILKYICACIAMEKINDGHFHFSIDHTAGRCHTNLTNINSKLRNFITYNGLKMVSIDIKNSQPFFSGLLLDPEYYEDGEKRRQAGSKKLSLSLFSVLKDIKLIQTIYNKIKSINLHHQTLEQHSSIMLVNQGAMGVGRDIENYLEMVQNGTLYEYLNHRIYDATGLDIQDRKKLKEIIFTVLFTDNRFIGQREAEPKRIFRTIFPNVYEVFAAIKKHDSTILPRLLQSIEARVMLDHVAKRISLERPDMPIFTIHDSIACPVGNEDYVARVIKEEMMKLTGMRPSAKYEYWCPSNLQPKNHEIAETKTEGKAA